MDVTGAALATGLSQTVGGLLPLLFFLKKDNEAITLIDTALQTASQYAQASAMSWIYTLIILAFVGLSFLIVQKFIVYQD